MIDKPITHQRSEHGSSDVIIITDKKEAKKDPCSDLCITVMGNDISRSMKRLESDDEELDGMIVETSIRCMLTKYKLQHVVNLIEGTTVSYLLKLMGKYIDVLFLKSVKNTHLFTKEIDIVVLNVNSNHWSIIPLIKQKRMAVIIDSMKFCFNEKLLKF